jgi:hypothetical protein
MREHRKSVRDSFDRKKISEGEADMKSALDSCKMATSLTNIEKNLKVNTK